MSLFFNNDNVDILDAVEQWSENSTNATANNQTSKFFAFRLILMQDDFTFVSTLTNNQTMHRTP